tara:strand:+ start:102 stop:239 length:138 start_codon:yes stop_codon:yes gene_type:complete
MITFKELVDGLNKKSFAKKLRVTKNRQQVKQHKKYYLRKKEKING